MRNRSRALACLILLGVQCAGRNDAKGEGAERNPLSVRLTDAEGKPVAGASIGFNCMVGAAARELVAEDRTQTEWYYSNHVRSDESGAASIDMDAFSVGRFCLVARHEGRKIIAIANVTSTESVQPIRMTLVPEREVLGQVVSSDLTDRQRSLGVILVTAQLDEKNAIGFECDAPHVRVVLPPGDYRLNAKGQATHYACWRTVTVRDDPQPQTFEPIDLPALRWVMLENQPAPEITDVFAWKNSAPLQLADVKGRCVLLEFWGYWCGPCIHEMPKLFRLHDKYSAQGLTIIGIHCDLGKDEQDPVDTVTKLDQRLSTVRDSVWGGRDIPFPVALVVGRATPFGGRLQGETICPAFAAYGVRPVPQLILIDPRGNVAQSFDPDDETHIARLEQLLQEK